LFQRPLKTESAKALEAFFPFVKREKGPKTHGTKKGAGTTINRYQKFIGLALLALLAFFTLSACSSSGLNDYPRLTPDSNRAAEAEALLRSDPQGPIPKPQLPQRLLARAVSLARDTALRAQRLEYVVHTSSDQLPDAKTLFEETAELYTLQDKPLYSRMTLNRRLQSSIGTGQDILKSMGYYDGEVKSNVEFGEAEQTVITIEFIPNTQYKIGEIKVLFSGPPDALEDVPVSPPEVSLTPLKIKKGDPALAAPILQAVDLLPDYLATRGYPFAEVTGTRYFLSPADKLLDMEITVYPGDFARMGELVITGDNPVRVEFIQNLVSWKQGDTWNQDAINSFRDSLFQKGLFNSIDVSVGTQVKDNNVRDIILKVERAPPRTVSGSLNFDSDFGPGAELAWEHRNLSGWGDDFKVEIPIWKDLQQLGVQYTRPYFLSKKQTFLASAALLREKTDSYELKSLSLQGGIERQLSRHLAGKLMVSLERGKLNEFFREEQDYNVVGFPLTLDWNWSDSFLDPTEGHRLRILFSPYYGHYYTDFNIIKTRVDGYQYFSLKENKTLILALRLSLGYIAGASTANLPASLRFFSGGGGSIRGFRYQSIGPKNAKGKPAGGNFLNEFSSELRWRFRESMGLVFFIDGGNLYDKVDFSELGKKFLWGGGIGFRYYTSMGPFRLDVATPLNPREGDSKFQIYISLGQSF
jgi:translocation and assembly module TamA